MNDQTMISVRDRAILRELAEKQLDYANRPINIERRNLWYEHNALKGDRPPVVIELSTFEDELLPGCQCEHEFARLVETELRRRIINFETVGDDKVVPPYFEVFWSVGSYRPGIRIDREFAADSSGRLLGYHQEHPIKHLAQDLQLLQPSVFKADRNRTLREKALVEDLIGDILPVKIKNSSLYWYFTPTQAVVNLMGMENMMYSMVDEPDEMHALMEYLEKDMLAFARWQEREGLLTLNNENDYIGSGSYGFSTELPSPEYADQDHVTLHDLWVNMNSQETVGISPAMFEEFFFPHYRNIAREFGLVYYGCCEPVHNVWAACISKLPGLRKVSISPWCDESFMGEALRNGKVIYSRKPSPNFIGVGARLDEEGLAASIRQTLQAAAGCKLEFIFRDIYTLGGDLLKPGRAVQVTRAMIERFW